MKLSFTPLKRQDGFTLVELMVVVAIIGLLSAVAIPNFKKYQAKSKVSEAKLQLSALYTAEAAFFSDFNIYAACLRYMGFDPWPETANRYYSVGFPDAASIADRDDAAHDAAVNAGLQNPYSGSWTGGGGPTVAQCDETATPTDGPIATAHAYDPSDLTSNNWPWYYAGRGMGAQIITAAADASTNPAGNPIGTCERGNINDLGEFGSCVGTQQGLTTAGDPLTDSMVYQAAAVGYISGDFITPATASGLNINQDKQFKSAFAGF